MEVEADGKETGLVLLKQGAEARVFESVFVGRRCIIKERFSKKYRHPSLDSKLTLKRLNAEARCMTKARKLGVPTPVLFSVDHVLHTLTFEFIEGPMVKEVLLEFGATGIVEESLLDIATQIGDKIAKLHDGGLIHGDLTTSNMLINKDTNQLVLIDFGLSFTSTLPEDKAVDLYVLERALISMHSSCGNVMERVLASYRKSSKQWCSTLNKLAQGSAPLINETAGPKAHHDWLIFKRAEPCVTMLVPSCIYLLFLTFFSRKESRILFVPVSFCYQFSRLLIFCRFFFWCIPSSLVWIRAGYDH
ncbi:hypothetical protein KSS87_006332 [Heliosperma pusillum]|nr:hypothetical protein KSS87_006332 [Heliosperma pusillum]